MNQNRGKQGSHSAHVPTNIRVMDSPKVACDKQKPYFVIPAFSVLNHKTDKTQGNLMPSELH